MNITSFDEVIKEGWLVARNCSGSNKFIVFKDKMKVMKNKINEWVKIHNAKKEMQKTSLIHGIEQVERGMEVGLAPPDVLLDHVSMLKE